MGRCAQSSVAMRGGKTKGRQRAEAVATGLSRAVTRIPFVLFLKGSAVVAAGCV